MAEERVDPKLPRSGVKIMPGGISISIVGESFYRAALTEIVGLAGDSYGDTMLWASLVPDFANPYDSNAVKVVIAGKQVGHLDREAAIAFRPVSIRIEELGCEVQCAAHIVGHRGIFGVQLDLGTPDECLKELA
jgi:hypothetical protein